MQLLIYTYLFFFSYSYNHIYSFSDSYLLKAKHWLLGEGIVENKKLKKMGKEAIALCLAHQPQ